MSVRKGYLYALILAVGLLLWTEAIDRWQHPAVEETPVPVQNETVQPWTSTEAVYECSLKAQELGLTVEGMHTAGDELQGSLTLTGSRESLQNFYNWLEVSGRFRSILSFQLRSEDESASQLSVHYQL